MTYKQKADKIVFVVGNSRSGTTMMGRVLGRAKEFFTLGELHFYGMLFDHKSDKGIKLSQQKSEELYANLICLEREGFFTNLRNSAKYEQEARFRVEEGQLNSFEEVYTSFLLSEAQKHNKSIPCEQTPKNLFFLNDIFKLPYEIKVVNMVRDPRDILSSQKRKWKRRSLGAKGIPLREAIRAWFNYHPITISLIWQSAIREYRKYENDSSDLLSVKFEDFLSKPSSELERICSFLGIDYDIELLSVPQVGSSDERDSNKVGIKSNRISSWQFNGVLSKTEIYICERLCLEEMKHMGYTPSGYKANLFMLTYYYCVFPFKMSVALLLNINRMRKIYSVIQKYFSFRGNNAS